jgi:hypothetical protein
MNRQISGCEPSRSLKPYSVASSPELTDFWFHLARSGSVASATTERPTCRGDSDRAKSAGPFSRRHRASYPRTRRKVSSIISERSHPGVMATAVAPLRSPTLYRCLDSGASGSGPMWPALIFELPASRSAAERRRDKVGQREADAFFPTRFSQRKLECSVSEENQ